MRRLEQRDDEKSGRKRRRSAKHKKVIETEKARSEAELLKDAMAGAADLDE